MNMQSNKIEKEAKMDQESTGLITVDGVEYKFSDMTDAAKAQLSNIQFVDKNRAIRDLVKAEKLCFTPFGIQQKA